jgi:NADH-quinone oxidoreductase subunit G
MAYGFDRSRYHENKRAVTEKNMGPLIKTVMTRCIHCTRCVRFVEEVAGTEEIGAIYRGENMQITTFLEHAVMSELSGNVIDLCPVGALTSKPYAFAARPWELKKTESVDVHDAVGSNIRVDARGAEVLRVLPRLNEDVNEEWISDKTRFACDGLKRQRIDTPYVRRDGRLQPATWAQAFEAIRARLTGVAPSRVAAIAGDLADAEAVKALKDLMGKLDVSSLECRQDGARFDVSSRAGWLFNTTIAGIEQADAILLVGTNPRREAAILNARIRKRYMRGGVKIALIGDPADLTYDYQHLGHGPDVLKAIADGSHPFAEVLRNAKAPMLILGSRATARADGAAIHGLARRVAERCGLVKDGWNGFNLLHDAAARVAALELGFVPGEGGRDLAGILDGASKGEVEVVYLLGADEIDTGRLGNAFVIYQGSHGDAGAHRADVILPGAAYTEKNATWVNTEGRVQLGRRSLFPPGEAREDWTILRALSDVLGQRLPYDNLGQLRAAMVAAAPALAHVDGILPAEWAAFGADGPVDAAPFAAVDFDFYLTNPICRASKTMAECSALHHEGGEKATGTHG